MARLVSALFAVFCLWSATALAAPADDINAVLGDASWEAISDAPPPTNEVERIRVHLDYVIRRLQNEDVSRLAPEVRARRAQALRHLGEYADAGVFPQRGDDGYLGRRPQFIDARGVHCAVGELIRRSGHAALARAIDAEFEFAYVADIASAELSEWAVSHGFTVRELAMIQPSYRPQAMKHDVDEKVERATEHITLACHEKGHAIPKTLEVQVTGSAAGDITVGAADGPFADCFIVQLEESLKGMRKVAADPFEKNYTLQLEQPAGWVKRHIRDLDIRTCRRADGTVPQTAKVNAKSTSEGLSVTVATTPADGDVQSCIAGRLESVLRTYKRGKWKFDVSGDRKLGALVTPVALEQAVRDGAKTQLRIACTAGPKRVTLTAKVARGDKSVAVTTQDGDAKFQECFARSVPGQVTFNLLRVGSENIASDADAETTVTIEPTYRNPRDLF